MNSLLSSLGLTRKKANPKPVSQIKLHPDCMRAHGSIVPLWLSGYKVEVLNPATNEWEDTDNPIFSPEYAYQLKTIPVPSRPAMNAPRDKHTTSRVDAPSAPQYPPTPPPLTTFKRGYVHLSRAGKRYVVLGSKYCILPNYSSATDPDSNPLIVMRYDEEVKPAVSCRDLQGNRADGSSKYSLTDDAVDVIPMPQIHDSTTYPGYILVYQRNGMKDVYLNKATGEVKFF